MKRKNIIIITGATSGMGAEFARQMDPFFTGIDEFWLIAEDMTTDAFCHKITE